MEFRNVITYQCDDAVEAEYLDPETGEVLGGEQFPPHPVKAGCEMHPPEGRKFVTRLRTVTPYSTVKVWSLQPAVTSAE